MIHLLEKGREVTCPKAEGFIEAKICANYRSYGSEYPFLTFWQGKENNKITSAICRFEDTVFLSVGENADYKELREFLSVIGFSHLQAEADTLRAMGFTDFKEYVVLKNDGKGTDRNCFDITENPPLKEVYNILFGNEEENIKPVSFDGWYADTSHRIRYGTAATLLVSGKAVAVLSHITEKSAVLSGVVTVCGERGKGLGASLLAYLKNNLAGKNILTATDENTAQFYIKNGFLAEQRIGIYKAGV